MKKTSIQYSFKAACFINLIVGIFLVIFAQISVFISPVMAQVQQSLPQMPLSSKVPQNKSTQDSESSMMNRVTTVEDDLKALKENQYKQLVDQANTTNASANLVIQWSGVFLTSFAFIVTVVGFFGVKEYLNIRDQYSNAVKESEKLKDLFSQRVKSIEDLEESVENKLQFLISKFERDNQTFIEVSYNFSIATDAYKKGDNKKAIEYYKRAFDMQPMNARFPSRIGRAYTNIGEINQAIQYFEKALEIDNENAEALRGLATSYRYVDLDKAIEYAKLSIEKDDKDIESLDYLGLLYRDKLFINESIEMHEKSRRINPRPETEFFLALCYTHKQDLPRARLMIQSATIGLREEKALERMRPLWAKTIECGCNIVFGDYDLALSSAQEIAPHMTTIRAAQGVLSHLHFLLRAVGRDDLVDDYTALFQGQLSGVSN